MRKKRDAKRDKHRSEPLANGAQGQMRRVSAEDEALDVAVRRSIKLHGA